MTVSSNRIRVQQFFTALEARMRGDEPALAELLHDTIRWHFPKSTINLGTPSDYDGKAEVMAMFQGAVAQYYQPDSIRFTYHAYTAEADRVHVHFSMDAITSNGKPYRNDYQSLFRLENDLIAEVWEYFDTAYVASLFQS